MQFNLKNKGASQGRPENVTHTSIFVFLQLLLFLINLLWKENDTGINWELLNQTNENAKWCILPGTL